MSIVVVGIDLSLTGTGLVAVCGSGSDYEAGRGPEVVLARRHDGRDLRGLLRLHEIESWVQKSFDELFFRSKDPVGVMFEGPGFSSKVAHSLGQLHGVVKLALWRRADALAFRMADVPPSTLKKFVTGSGAADKNVVMKQVFKRWGFDSDDDNLCDAYAAALVGLCCFGEGTSAQRKAVDGKVSIYESRSASNGVSPRGDTVRVAGRTVPGRFRRRRLA